MKFGINAAKVENKQTSIHGNLLRKSRLINRRGNYHMRPRLDVSNGKLIIVRGVMTKASTRQGTREIFAVCRGK